MTIPLVVAGANDFYRRGLVACLLEDGFLINEPDDVSAWAKLTGLRAIILRLGAGVPLAPVVESWGRRTDLVLLALLMDPGVEAYGETLSAGGAPVAADLPPDDIIAALKAAIRGRVLLPKEIASALVAGMKPVPQAAREGLVPPRLGSTEMKIMRRIAQGDTDRQIAAALCFSERTVRRRMRNIFATLGIETRVEAGIWAAQVGIHQDDDLPCELLPDGSRTGLQA